LQTVVDDSSGKLSQDLQATRGKVDSVVAATANFASLQQSAQEAAAQRAGLDERVRYCEKLLGDNAENHGKELEATRQRIDQLHSRVAEHHSQLAYTVAAQERVSHLEKGLADLAERNAGELAGAQAKLDQHLARLTQCERLGAQLGELQKAHAGLAGDMSSHASLADRVANLEKSLGATSDRHAQELNSLKTAYGKHDQLYSLLSDERALRERYQSTVNEHLTKEKEARLVHQTLLEDRLNYLEKVVGDSSSSHAHADLGAGRKNFYRGGISAAGGDLGAYNASVVERLKYVEKAFVDSADKQSKEMDAYRQRTDQLHGRLAEHHSQLSHLTTIQDRLVYVEKLLGDSADKHAEELAAAHLKLEQMQSRLAARDGHHVSISNSVSEAITERLNFLEKAFGDMADKNAEDLAGANAKVERFVGRLTACERQNSSLGELQKATASLANNAAATQAYQGPIEERLTRVELLAGGLSEKHSAELDVLKVAQAKHETMGGRQGEELRKLAEELRKLRTSVATTSDTVGDTERTLSEAVEKQAREIQAQQGSLQGLAEDLRKLRTSAATTSDSVGDMERALGEAAEKQAREIQAQQASLQSRVVLLEQRLRDELAGMAPKATSESLREHNDAMYQDLLSRDKAARLNCEDLIAQERADRGKVIAVVNQRLEALQTRVGSFDSVVLKETKDRVLELQKVWDAISKHTHDVSSQAKTDVERLPVRATATIPTYTVPAVSTALVDSTALPVTRQYALRQPSPAPIRGRSTSVMSMPTTVTTSSPVSLRSFEVSPERQVEKITVGQARFGGETQYPAEVS